MTRHAGRIRGTTLVETMVAMVLLAVVSLGTVAYVTLSKRTTVRDSVRYSALLKATERLEAVRAAAYAVIAPSAQNYNTWYLDNMTGNWRLSAGNQGETVTLDSQPHPMTTTVQYLDADGGTASYDCLRVTVTVQYGAGSNDIVVLQTFQSP